MTQEGDRRSEPRRPDRPTDYPPIGERNGLRARDRRDADRLVVGAYALALEDDR